MLSQWLRSSMILFYNNQDTGANDNIALEARGFQLSYVVCMLTQDINGYKETPAAGFLG